MTTETDSLATQGDDNKPMVANASTTAQGCSGEVSRERVEELGQKWQADPQRIENLNFDGEAKGPESLQAKRGYAESTLGQVGGVGSFREIKNSIGQSDVAPVPAIGRIVHYTLNDDDCAAVNRRRVYNRKPERAEGHPVGISHVGDTVFAGQVFPMMIVAVGEHGAVSGQVFLPGNDVLWIKDVAAGGEGPGSYQWPQRV